MYVERRAFVATIEPLAAQAPQEQGVAGPLNVNFWSFLRGGVEPLAASKEPPATTQTPEEQRAAGKKRVQNSSFKGVGLAMSIAGLAGFAPSLYKLVTDTMWSVSHNLPHTENDFLRTHALFMVVWMVAVFFQLWSGGVPERRTFHRVFGWLGVGACALGMVFAACNMVKYDFITDKQPSAGIYTLVLVLGISFDLAMGVLRVKQKRFAEHKDWMLMCLMLSLDPAIHRLAMWLIRVGADGHHLNADTLLTIGKMPANFVLVVGFGAMSVRARRVNAVTVGNLLLQLFAFVMGVAGTFADTGDCEGCVGPAIWGTVLGSAVLLLLLVAALCAVELRIRRAEKLEVLEERKEPLARAGK